MDAELGGLREFYDDLMAEIHSLRGQLELCSLNSGSPGNLPQDCWEAYEMGFHKSGRYTIQPRYWGAIQVRNIRRNLLREKKCRGGSEQGQQTNVACSQLTQIHLVVKLLSEINQNL